MPLIDGLVRHGVRAYYDVMAPVLRPSRERKFATLINDGLPPVIVPMVRFLVTGEVDRETAEVAAKMEAIRSHIAADGFKTVNLMHGRRTLARVARTGKGTALHILAKSARSATILELGACAGISGGYFASSPFCTRFVTVEGSADLTKISRQTLTEIGPHTEVVNALFDDALNVLLPRLPSIDLVFIDGHHEKAATIHYYERILPKLADNAVVIFDDISWTHDMRDMWNTVVREPGFSHSFDFGEVGICIRSPGATARNWDMRPLSGHMVVM